jgi:putative Mg2+ transporter-C (MgtC) family protein
MVISKYGFADLLGVDHIALDPSRIAAQIVSGIGFIGGGLIFVRRDAVRGLTTAATVWLVAAVGMACGAGLPVLAVAAPAGHFLITRGYPHLSRPIATRRGDPPTLRLSYADGHGVLRAALRACTERGFTVNDIEVTREDLDDGSRVAAVTLELAGRGDLGDLAGELAELPGVHTAHTGPTARE